MLFQIKKFLVIFLLTITGIGCSGIKTFPYDNVRAGDTVAIAAGLKKHFTRNDIAVTITPASGAPITYNAGDPAIRAIVNFYPDPLSSLVVSDEANSNITDSSQTYSIQIKNNHSNGEKDYWQTVAFIDMPSITNGVATIDMSNSFGETASSTVNVVPGSGTPYAFEATGVGALIPKHMLALERIDHYEIAFTGTTIPHAIQLDLAYANTLLGHLVNPLGTVKNMSWTDTGSGYRVILMPTGNNPLETISDFKFYVGIVFGFGGSTTLNIVPGSVQAFDINGSPVAGVNASVALVEGSAGLFP